MMVALLLALGAGCTGTVLGNHQRTLQSASSGKSLVIYSHSSFEVDGRRSIPQEDIERTLQGTGFFTQSDIQEFAPTLKSTLETLASRERAVIVGVGTVRPPRYHVAVQGNELVVILYHGNNAMSRHASPIGHGNAGFVHERPASQPPATHPPATHPPATHPPATHPPAATPGNKPEPKGARLSPDEVRTRLRRLQSLKEQGLISDEDYERERQKLIKQL